MKKKKDFKNTISDFGISLIPSIAMMGAIEGIMKMSGLFGDDKSPQKLAEEMMAGAVRGILEHFEYKLDDLKREGERKDEEIGKLKERNAQLNEMLDKSSKTTQKSKK